MRNPLRKLAWCLALLAVAGALSFFGAREFERAGETVLGISLFAGGLALGTLSLAGLIFSGQAAAGQAKLLSGRSLVASWHVSAAEWDAFRAADADRSGRHPELMNELWVRRDTPAGGVDVLVGERSLIVDGSYHALSPAGNPSVTGVAWLSSSPPCVEFTLLYLRSGGEGTHVRPMRLRIPVSAAARASGARVIDHYADRIRGARARSERSWPRVRATLLTLLGLFAALAIASVLLTA